MVYRSPTGLPRLDLILGTETDDPATARAAFTYGIDDFFANAFDASTAGIKSGVQLNAAEAAEKRQREEDEWDSFREGMAELAYLQEQITIGGVSLTVAEHGRLGKRLSEDAAFRSAVSAKMKADNPNLTDAQIDTAMDRYSEWARLKNIPPEKRTDEENERLRQLEPVVRTDPTVGALVKTGQNFTDNPDLAGEQSRTASASFQRAGIGEVADMRAALADTSGAEPTSDNSAFKSAFSAAVTSTPVMAKPEDLASAADAAAQQRAASFSI